VRDLLARRGASFLSEIAEGAGLLHAQVEEALASLVAAGLVTCDSFAGLRALLAPSEARRPAWRRSSLPSPRLDRAGRWSLVTRPPSQGTDAPLPEALLESIARSLLARYGVVMKKLLAREGRLPPWRDLLRTYHRLEARGEIRGGRFVAGLPGEQFALPEAVSRLRAIRREPLHGTLVSLTAADPLNLVGILLPGRRVAAIASHRVLLRDGQPLALLEARQITFLAELEAADLWSAEKALLRKPATALASTRAGSIA
jgi:ATP-dependent Lhr-like helicase